MVREDERLKLLDRLIAEVRITCKKGSPDAVIFAGEMLRELAARREALQKQNQQELNLAAA